MSGDYTIILYRFQSGVARYFSIESTSNVNSTSSMNICWNQHQMTSKIDIELKYHPNRYYLSDIEFHSAKIHEKNVIIVLWSIWRDILWVFGMFALNQLYQKSNLKGQISNWTQNTDIVQHEEKRREVEEQKALSIFDNANEDVAKRSLMRLTIWKRGEYQTKTHNRGHPYFLTIHCT